MAKIHEASVTFENEIAVISAIQKSGHRIAGQPVSVEQSWRKERVISLVPQRQESRTTSIEDKLKFVETNKIFEDDNILWKVRFPPRGVSFNGYT
jgi:hypothetical protein